MSIPFVIAFTSDLGLRYLTENYYITSYLNEYFAHTTPIESAISAGGIIVIAMRIMDMVPSRHFGWYCILAILIGYVLDVLIEKMSIYPHLKPYYEKFGSGFWGSLTLLFVVVINKIILNVTRNKKKKWNLF